MDFLEKYDIKIKDKDLLLTALTHSSYSNEHDCDNYERLEFLGDAVLETITSEYFYKNYDLKEGEMTKMRAKYVCEKALSKYADVVGYIPFIRVGKGQANNINDTIIADIFEAIIGCIFLEFGFDRTKKYVLEVISPFIESGTDFYSDYKSLIQELVQTSKKSVDYKLVKEEGPAHDKTYVVELLVDGVVFGTGTGKNKKEAEQQAAYEAYKKSARKE